MQAVFKSAVYHVEPEVLGRRLLPLSLGHAFLLLAAESPFMCGGFRSLPEFAFAVGVCSRSWEDASAWVVSPNLAKDCKAWGRKCKGMDFAAECATFESYLNEFTVMPERWQGKGARNKPSQHPWPLLMATALLDKVGESRAWNMPLPLALSYWSANAELNGDTSLVTDKDMEASAKLRALRDSAQKGAA